jgi:hypothetical protein
MSGITKIPGTIEVVDGNVDTLLTRLTDTRAGNLDNLGSSGDVYFCYNYPYCSATITGSGMMRIINHASAPTAIQGAHLSVDGLMLGLYIDGHQDLYFKSSFHVISAGDTYLQLFRYA